MNTRMIALLAGLLALPGLGYAQSVQPTGKPPTAAPMSAAKTPAAAPSAALIDVNSADETALDALPGVGPARGKAIVANRPYTDKQQLLDKKVLPANVYAGLQDKIALVNVNKTPAADMAKILPNVGPVRAQQIVDKRPYATPQDLVTKGALTQGVLDSIKGLVTTS